MDAERNNKRKGIVVAALLHVAMLLLFFFMLAWTAPDPPIPEYGIELNMSLSDAEVDNDDKPISSESPTEVTDVETPTEPVEEVESQPVDPIETPVEEAIEPVESPDEQVVTEDLNSPDVVEKVVEKEQVKEVKPPSEEVKNEKETKEKEVQETTPAKPAVDQRAIYKKTEPGSGGGSQGASLDLSGWVWDERPNPNDQSIENGKIVFRITVDDMGEIINVSTIEKTVSPSVEKIYRDAVMDLTFSRTAENRSTAPQSMGKITFIIKSK